MLGEKPPATMAFLEQCHDFWDNEESYQMRAVADATFPLQVAVYLDHCFQLYLGNCAHAKTPNDIDEKWLLLASFDVKRDYAGNVPSPKCLLIIFGSAPVPAVKSWKMTRPPAGQCF